MIGHPADVGLAHTDVELRTADGEVLEAWYVPSTNGAAVVLLAGAGSTRDDELDHAAVLARHGYGVMLPDVRGHGGSTGEAMQFGWWVEADIAPAIDHLAARPDVSDGRIGVVGMSMGAQQAVAAAVPTIASGPSSPRASWAAAPASSTHRPRSTGGSAGRR